MFRLRSSKRTIESSAKSRRNHIIEQRFIQSRSFASILTVALHVRIPTAPAVSRAGRACHPAQRDAKQQIVSRHALGNEAVERA